VAAAVLMGVSGSGKSTVGKALAQRLGWAFADGDIFHPRVNVEKMRAAQPLDDADRAPWLSAIAAQIGTWHAEGVKGIIACSALKRRYRDIIIAPYKAVQLIYLQGSQALVAERLRRRHGHFMPAGLLDSQFAALEPPAPDEKAIVVSIEQPVDAIVEYIVTALSSRRASMEIAA